MPEINLEDIQTDSVPVCIKIPELHFSLWNPPTISKIASYIGKLIKTDKLTTIKGKLEYARILIDMRITEAVPDRIPYKVLDYMSKHGLKKTCR